MGENESRRSELEIDGLSLIDVSSEDDSLLFSSFLDPASKEFSEADMDDKVLGFLGDIHDYDEEIPVSSLEEKEEVLQPYESPEPEKMMKSGKYNLRKSLAWDNAFFTSAGVLEPEELSSMLESNHNSEKQTLSTIQEDVHRSTESMSTLNSDCTVGDGPEFVLFEDIRASIQRSTGSSDAATPDKKELGGTNAATTSTSVMMDPVSHDKMKSKASPKKLSIRAQGLGKATKQPVATKGLSTSISKPPKGLSKVGPVSIASMKRASLDVNKAKQEKDSKTMAGKGPQRPKISISGSARPVLPKPVAPSKASLRSSAASKNELTSSCSSLESCASASSSASHKSSVSSIRKKSYSSSPLAKPSLGYIAIPRAASRNITQPRNPPLSANLASKAKLSSSVSSASSNSDCSSESSQASTPNKMAKGNQKTISGERGSANGNAPEALKPHNNSSGKCSVGYVSKANELVHEGVKRFSTGNGGAVHPASMRPTGLRMPSPKIGFFDGVRSVARTPTGNMQPRPGVASGLARQGGHNPNGSLTCTKSGKFQPARSPLQESSNSKTRASSISRSPMIVSASSPEIQNRTSPRTCAEKQLKGEGDNELKSARKNGSPALVKDKGSRGRQNAAMPKETANIVLGNGEPESSVDRNSASGCKNTILPTKVAEEGEILDKTLYNQIDKPTKQFGDAESDKKPEGEKDFTGVSLTHASEPKTAGGEALDNASFQRTPLAINNSAHHEDGMLSVPTISEKPTPLPSLENIPAGFS